MKMLPQTEEMQALARRLVWFEEPADSLSDAVRFMAYAFERATHEDMSLLRRHVSDAEMREALDAAPPGIIHPRSWAYWNAKMGRYPAPSLPRRQLG